MISYPISKTQLESLITAKKRNWLKEAAARTKQFRQKKAYAEKSTIWSQIKPVYMQLQGDSKCAYCERKMESLQYGKNEQDVEHFRPKGNVGNWQLPAQLRQQGIRATAVPSKKGGYYLLPYHVFNYAASCKPCNSALKSDFFPIAGKYNLKGSEPSALLKEDPLLIYPIGTFDEKAETLIKFYGISPQPTAQSGHKRNRALVTIEFFKLDDAIGRKNLLLDRANVIVGMYPYLEKLATGITGEDRSVAERLIKTYISNKGKHTNCAKSFKSLFESNPGEAKALYKEAVTFIERSS